MHLLIKKARALRVSMFLVVLSAVSIGGCSIIFKPELRVRNLDAQLGMECTISGVANIIILCDARNDSKAYTYQFDSPGSYYELLGDNGVVIEKQRFGYGKEVDVGETIRAQEIDLPLDGSVKTVGIFVPDRGVHDHPEQSKPDAAPQSDSQRVKPAAKPQASVPASAAVGASQPAVIAGDDRQIAAAGGDGEPTQPDNVGGVWDCLSGPKKHYIYSFSTDGHFDAVLGTSEFVGSYTYADGMLRLQPYGKVLPGTSQYVREQENPIQFSVDNSDASGKTILLQENLANNRQFYLTCNHQADTYVLPAMSEISQTDLLISRMLRTDIPMCAQMFEPTLRMLLSMNLPENIREMQIGRFLSGAPSRYNCTRN